MNELTPFLQSCAEKEPKGIDHPDGTFVGVGKGQNREEHVVGSHRENAAAQTDQVYGLNRGVGWNKDKKVFAQFYDRYTIKSRS